MEVRILNKTFPLEVMTTDEDKKKGMMGREELDGGMLFNMGMGHHKFWMKDCKIPLDIIFLNKNKIARIYRNCEPCDICTKSYNGLGDNVLEFPAGTASGWKDGDKVFFLN